MNSGSVIVVPLLRVTSFIFHLVAGSSRSPRSLAAIPFHEFRNQQSMRPPVMLAKVYVRRREKPLGHDHGRVLSFSHADKNSCAHGFLRSESTPSSPFSHFWIF